MAEDVTPNFAVEVLTGETGEARITLSGELDMSTAPGLAEALGPLLDGASSTTVVFELAGLAFVDSSGLAVMASVAARGHRVLLRSASPLIRQVVSATGLEQILHVVDE